MLRSITYLPPYLILLSCLLLIGSGTDAQDKKPGPQPLGGKAPPPQRLAGGLTGMGEDLDAPELLEVSYLAKRPRGSVIELHMMSGMIVRGRLMNVTSEHDLIVIQWVRNGKTHHAVVKASAIESLEYVE